MTLPAAPQVGPVGAYGLHLEGVEAARTLLVPAEHHWPTFQVRSELGKPPWRESDLVTDSKAELRLQTGGEILIERDDGVVVFTTLRPIAEWELVHPYLAPVAAVAGYWFGRESFHAGAFVVDGAAWAVLGQREAGKSTLLASLALRGITVISDDMLILDGVVPFAGPRSIDLRSAAARHLGVGEPLGVVGARERWRLQLDPMTASEPLRGWIFPAWGDRLDVSELSPHERVARLGSQRGVRLPAKDPARLLDLAALPACELRRPRDWAALEPATDLLLNFVRGRSA